jgi:hypothetical protein
VIKWPLFLTLLTVSWFLNGNVFLFTKTSYQVFISILGHFPLSFSITREDTMTAVPSFDSQRRDPRLVPSLQENLDEERKTPTAKRKHTV